MAGFYAVGIYSQEPGAPLVCPSTGNHGQLDARQGLKASGPSSMGAMHTSKCVESGQLNLLSDWEINALAAALACLPTDIYEAVAYVGDRICCIRSHVQKTLTPSVGHEARVKVCELPSS